MWITGTGWRLAEVAARADRIASGLAKIGVKQGDCLCMLMRNDIAFLEAGHALE